jgi:hypothetical protein
MAQPSPYKPIHPRRGVTRDGRTCVYWPTDCGEWAFIGSIKDPEGGMELWRSNGSWCYTNEPHPNDLVLK